MNQVNNETPAVLVLKSEQKPVEVLSTPAKPKKKRYHKKSNVTVTEVVQEVGCIAKETKEEVAKLNPFTWIKLQWSKFALWLKRKY